MNKNLIKKMFAKNDKKATDIKTTKEDRKTLLAINKKLLELLEEN